MENLYLLIIYSFIGSVAGLLGGVVFLFKKEWANYLATISVPLAAGVLLSLSLLDLWPQAVDEIGETAFLIVLFVFVALFLIERFLFYFHHHVESFGQTHSGHSHKKDETVYPLVVIGDTIHNFIDGVVIGSTFLVNPGLALVVSLSTFIHETPHEIADFGIFLDKGFSRWKAFYINLLSALATFPGAILSYYLVDKIKAGNGILLAIAAGFFLYVATTDFLPEASQSSRGSMGKQALFLIIGVLAIAFLHFIFPEI